MNIAIADDVIIFTMTRFNFSKLVCLVVKSAGTVPIPPKISSKRFQGRDGEFCKEGRRKAKVISSIKGFLLQCALLLVALT